MTVDEGKSKVFGHSPLKQLLPRLKSASFGEFQTKGSTETDIIKILGLNREVDGVYFELAKCLSDKLLKEEISDNDGRNIKHNLCLDYLSKVPLFMLVLLQKRNAKYHTDVLVLMKNLIKTLCKVCVRQSDDQRVSDLINMIGIEMINVLLRRDGGPDLMRNILRIVTGLVMKVGDCQNFNAQVVLLYLNALKAMPEMIGQLIKDDEVILQWILMTPSRILKDRKGHGTLEMARPYLDIMTSMVKIDGVLTFKDSDRVLAARAIKDSVLCALEQNVGVLYIHKEYGSLLKDWEVPDTFCFVETELVDTKVLYQSGCVPLQPAPSKVMAGKMIEFLRGVLVSMISNDHGLVHAMTRELKSVETNDIFCPSFRIFLLNVFMTDPSAVVKEFTEYRLWDEFINFASLNAHAFLSSDEILRDVGVAVLSFLGTMVAIAGNMAVEGLDRISSLIDPESRALLMHGLMAMSQLLFARVPGIVEALKNAPAILCRVADVDKYYRHKLINGDRNPELLYTRAHIFRLWMFITEASEFNGMIFKWEQMGPYFASLMCESEYQPIMLQWIDSSAMCSTADACFAACTFLKLVMELAMRKLSDERMYSLYNKIFALIRNVISRCKRSFGPSVYKARTFRAIALTCNMWVCAEAGVSDIADVPADFVFPDVDGLQTMVVDVIKLLWNIGQRNRIFREQMNDLLYHVSDDMIPLARFIRVDTDIIDLLLSFAVNRKITLAEACGEGVKCSLMTVENLDPIRMLNEWTKNTDQYERILRVFVLLAKRSIANCYRFFQSSCFNSFLERYTMGVDPEAPLAGELVLLISMYFCDKNETNALLNVLAKCERRDSIQFATLLPAAVGVPDQASKCPSAFFHLAEGSGFKIERANDEFPVDFSVSIRFDEVEEPCTFFSLKTDTIVFRLCITKDHMVLGRVIGEGRVVIGQIEVRQVPPWTWIRVGMRVGLDKLEFVVEDTVKSLDMAPPLDRSSRRMVWGSSKCRCDIENIQISNADSKGKWRQTGHYSAKFVHLTKCINIVKGYDDASFFGLHVPYFPSFMSSIAAFGGAKVILPLLRLVDSAVVPDQYLTAMLGLIRCIAKSNRNTVDMNFFHALNYCLKQIDSANFSINTSRTFMEFCRLDEIFEDMKTSVWSDLALLWRFPGVIPGFWAPFSAYLKNCISLRSVFVQLYGIGLKDKALDRESFLKMAEFAWNGTDDKDANIETDILVLFAFACFHMPNIARDVALTFIQTIVEAASPKIMALHQKMDFIDLFQPFFRDTKRTMNDFLCGLGIYHTILAKLGCNDVISYGIAVRNVIVNPVSELTSVDVMWFFITCFEEKNKTGRMWMEYIPPLCLTANWENKDISAEMSGRIRSAIMQSRPESWKVLPNWEFWLLLLVVEHEQPDPWVQWLLNNCLHDMAAVVALSKSLFCMSQVRKWPYKSLMAPVLEQCMADTTTCPEVQRQLRAIVLLTDAFVWQDGKGPMNSADVLSALRSLNFKALAKRAVLVEAPGTISTGKADDRAELLAAYIEELGAQCVSFVEDGKRLMDISPVNTSRLAQADGEIMRAVESIVREDHRDERIWLTMQEELASVWGGVWSKSEIHHRKLDQAVDRIGRRLRTELNMHFDDHREASQSRDRSTNKKQANAIRVRQLEVMPSNDVELEANVMKLPCTRVAVSTVSTGYIVCSKSQVYFSAVEGRGIMNQAQVNVVSQMVVIDIHSIKYVLWRRYRHQDIALEIFDLEGKSFFFAFESAERRSRLVSRINSARPRNLEVIQTKRISGISDVDQLHHGITGKWCKGEISNYEYLYWLNMFAGRSFNDLSQYPVFPIVIADYVSETLDLSSPSVYRDLSKPIGALNQTRVARLQATKAEALDTKERCLYRSFYSTAAYVTHFLVRCEPFTTLHIQFQRDKFDTADRLFKSMKEMWKSVRKSDMDFREAIPEFFTFPDFLDNREGYDLGVLQDSTVRVDHVILPPWAQNSSMRFVALNRLALESPHVSSNIHLWIDLIFGSKQRGPRAEENLNDFHAWSYSTALPDPDGEDDIIMDYAANLGIVPGQLFKEDHPKRDIASPYSFATVPLLGPQIIETTCVLANVIAVAKCANGVFVVTADGMTKIGYDSVTRKLSSVNEKQHEFLPTEMLTCLRSTPRLICVLPADKVVVVSAPWRDTFSLFDYSSKKKILFTSDAANACLSVIASDNRRVVVTGSQDSVVTIHHLCRSEKQKTRRLYVTGHTGMISDVAISTTMDLVASCDKNMTLLVFTVSAARLVLAKRFEYRPIRVFLSELGLVLVVFRIPKDHDFETSIVAVDLLGRQIASATIPGRAWSYETCVFPDCTEFLVVGGDATVFVFRCHDLALVASHIIGDRITSIAQCSPTDVLLVCGKVCRIMALHV